MPMNHLMEQPLMEPAQQAPSPVFLPNTPWVNPQFYNHHHRAAAESSIFCGQNSAFSLNQNQEEDEVVEEPPLTDEREKGESMTIPHQQRQLHGDDNNDKEPMFEKPLTPSDVGKLNRLVVPKQHAEKYFPLAAAANDKGLLLNFKDESGKCWRFRFSYWNSSQSYVLTKGWSRFVKEKQLDAGDVVLFEHHRLDCDRLFIGSRRCSTAAVGHETGVAQPAAVAAAGGVGGGGWTPLFNFAHSHGPRPLPPYQPDSLHADKTQPNLSDELQDYNVHESDWLIDVEALATYLLSPEPIREALVVEHNPSQSTPAAAMSPFNVDRLKRKNKQATNEEAPKKLKLSVGECSGTKNEPHVPQVTADNSVIINSPAREVVSGSSSRPDTLVATQFISLVDDPQLAWRKSMALIENEEVNRQQNCTSYQLGHDLNHDLIRALTRSMVLVYRMMIAEGEVDVHKSKAITAICEKDAAIVAMEEEKKKLTSQLEDMKKKHEAEKAELIERCRRADEDAATAVERFKSSEAFQDELEPVFLQAFEVARGRATQLYPGIDFSNLQPVD